MITADDAFKLELVGVLPQAATPKGPILTLKLSIIWPHMFPTRSVLLLTLRRLDKGQSPK